MELMSYRNLDYLHRNRIIYKRMPVTDIPTETYDWGWYYENGTSEYYSLFNTKVRINSYKSLKWHIIVLRYLNMNIEPQEFYTLCEYIIDQNNGFITFGVSVSTLHNILAEVLEIEFANAPNTRIRKIIFKDGIGLSAVDKLKIVGSVIGRKKNATNFDIYESMLYLHHQRQKITMSKIAESLNVSERTLYRNMDNDLKVEKKILNEALQQGELFAL